MLFKIRFFGSSKQYLPQTIDALPKKSGKKKSSSKENPIQVSKISGKSAKGKPLAPILQDNVLLKDCQKVFSLSQVKMTCSEWNHPRLNSISKDKMSNRPNSLPRNGKNRPIITHSNNGNYWDHPAFKSSLYTRTKIAKQSAVCYKTGKIGRLDIMRFQTLQSIQESDEEHIL